MGPATTCPNPGRIRAETRLLPPLVPSDGKIVVHIADRSIAVGVAHTVVVGGRPAGRIEAGTAVDIAEMVGGRAAAPVLAGTAVEPDIGVAVAVEGMLGIVVVGEASVAAGTAQKRAGGPGKRCM